MKTINTTLPVYDRIEKQIYNRVKASDLDIICPTITPQYRLPSMQWNVEDDAPGDLYSILLVDKAGITTELLISGYFDIGPELNTSWTNDSYSNFASGDAYTIACEKTVAAGIDYCFSNTFAVTVGDIIRVPYIMTVTHDQPPDIVVVSALGADISNIGTMVACATERSIELIVTATDAAARIRIRNTNTELAHWDCSIVINKSVAPRLVTDGTDYFFEYHGEVLGSFSGGGGTFLLPVGEYYLKMTSAIGHIYYSDWFFVTCVYPNLIKSWTNVGGGAGYDAGTWSTSGTQILAAITAGGATCSSSDFNLVNLEQVTVIFFLTNNGGQLPTLTSINLLGGVEAHICTAGLNTITYTATINSTYYFNFSNAGAADWETSEVLIIRHYSEKYIRINFENTCDIAGIYYEGGFEQSLFLESETLEPTFPYIEKGHENGDGRFIPAFQRQDKIWIMRTKLIPQFIIDVLYRLKIHDVITLYDTVGNEYIVKHVDVEHDWQYDDKYYALAQVSLDLDEYGLVTGCCD